MGRRVLLDWNFQLPEFSEKAFPGVEGVEESAGGFPIRYNSAVLECQDENGIGCFVRLIPAGSWLSAGQLGERNLSF
jgi:hypothetical protein